MSKSNKPASEPGDVANKLRYSLKRSPATRKSDSPPAIQSAAAQSGSTSSSTKTDTGNQPSGWGSANLVSPKPSRRCSSAPQLRTKIPPAGRTKIPPARNLLPSGKDHITGMTQGAPRSFSPETVLRSTNHAEVSRIGNEMLKNSYLKEALMCFDRAIVLSPDTGIYHVNRGDALSRLKRIGEAVTEYQAAIKLHPNFTWAYHRLANLLLRLGQVEHSWEYAYAVKDQPSPKFVRELELVNQHLTKCTEARRRSQWDIALNRVISAMDSGADCSPQLAMCKVELLLKLHRIEDAETERALLPKVEQLPTSFSKTRFFDISGDAYMYFVNSQLELALGRSENALTAAGKALKLDPGNKEVEAWFKNVNFTAAEPEPEALTAAGEASEIDPKNQKRCSCKRETIKGSDIDKDWLSNSRNIMAMVAIMFFSVGYPYAISCPITTPKAFSSIEGVLYWSFSLAICLNTMLSSYIIIYLTVPTAIDAAAEERLLRRSCMLLFVNLFILLGAYVINVWLLPVPAILKGVITVIIAALFVVIVLLFYCSNIRLCRNRNRADVAMDAATYRLTIFKPLLASNLDNV